MFSSNCHLSIVVLFPNSAIPPRGALQEASVCACVSALTSSRSIQTAGGRWGLPEIFWGRGSAWDCGVLGSPGNYLLLSIAFSAGTWPSPKAVCKLHCFASG